MVGVQPRHVEMELGWILRALLWGFTGNGEHVSVLKWKGNVCSAGRGVMEWGVGGVVGEDGNTAILGKGDRADTEDTCPRDVYREVTSKT